jgi:hypothetical protein
MSSIFQKMNLKDQKEIVVLNAPPGFQSEVESLVHVKVLNSLDHITQVDFVLAFVTLKKEVDAISPIVAQKARGDAVIWFAYPKGTSKKYKCDFNRDNGWNVIYSLGFQPVRMVAIDEDWSALRVRKSDFVKSK